MADEEKKDTVKSTRFALASQAVQPSTRLKAAVRFRETDNAKDFTGVNTDTEVQSSSRSKDAVANNKALTKRQSINRAYTARILKTDASYRPTTFIDVETGEKITTHTQKFLDSKRFKRVDEDGNLAKTEKTVQKGVDVSHLKASDTDVTDLQNYQEIDFLGSVWRRVLKSLILLTNDRVNYLRFTRGLQQSLPFLTGYESFVLNEVITAFEAGDTRQISFVLRLGFSNRNVSRVMVQQMARFDILWHQSTQFRYNRWFDAFGVLAIIGITGFPVTENFPNTRNHAIGSVFRIVLGSGFWWTRLLTGRQALVTDDENVVAQNLAAEVNGFEVANRNQHGTNVGRQKTNEFRKAQRLPTDESIVRSFIGNPLSTMVNNGVEHVLRQLGKHYHNMLFQPFGNFAHQRMEQINPFEFMRFHMPVIFVALVTLRGLSPWDSTVLAPYVEKLQLIGDVDSVMPLLDLIQECRETIAGPLCGGIASRIDIFLNLLKALENSLGLLQEEAEEIRDIVDSVEPGIRVGSDLITSVNWKCPSESVMLQAVYDVCHGSTHTREVNAHAVRRALNLLSPKDKRCFIELVNQGLRNSKPAKLLASRTVTLLQREIRRERLDARLIEMSKGEYVSSIQFKPKTAYWLVDQDGHQACYIYEGKKTGSRTYRFTHRAAGHDRFVEESDKVEVFEYVEVAETITRAQHAFMTIELDNGKKFAYAAFMEFTFLRELLRELIVLAEIACEELDNARLNVLQSIQHAIHTEVHVEDLEPGEIYYAFRGKKYVPFSVKAKYDPDEDVQEDPQFEKLKLEKLVTVPPQNLIVIGGGPTGLLTTMHTLENVLLTNGKVRLYESRDAFAKGGATFERSQIVRLDSRWINMLRYHLGTVYEDVYIPASGETDSHFGNTLPTQGFVEITIKDMEAMMHIWICKLGSRLLLQHDTNSGAQYDVKTNTLVKRGKALKVDDLILQKTDPAGHDSEEDFTWRVAELTYITPLGPDEVELGKEYAVFIKADRKLIRYALVGKMMHSSHFIFQPFDLLHHEIEVTATNWPPVYPKGTKEHGGCLQIIIESHVKDTASNSYAQKVLEFSKVENEPFVIDIEHFHVAEAIGKPHGSSVHFEITTEEPYGVCCLSGAKVSWGMHNFGTRRWKNGIIDDIRSHTDQNTRVIGDFTKTVNSNLIAEKMYQLVSEDINWKLHLEKLARDLGFEDELTGIWTITTARTKLYMEMRPFRRTHLQTRFFETGDNYYLGMEFTREYDRWKKDAIEAFMGPVRRVCNDKRKIGRAAGTIANNIDRLWYDATLEVIRTGDVYNPGGQTFVPRLVLIDAHVDSNLGDLSVGESFRVTSNMAERYEVLVQNISDVVVRDVEGYVQRMSKSTKVRRGGNLTRSPDGNDESKVAIATFPVGHYVNYRTMRLNNNEKGYVFAFCGDEQSTPHFMRYSGLTGAAINAMLMNNFIGDAAAGVSFIDRFRRYSEETNWSNGEVVQRGTGANYGEDGFLQPGFPYLEGIKYLHSKVIEYKESDQDPDVVLSRDWKVKFAAALIPRGVEFNSDYIAAMTDKFVSTTFDYFVSLVEADKAIDVPDIGSVLRARSEFMTENDAGDPEEYWHEFVDGLDLPGDALKALELHVYCAKRLEIIIHQIVEFAEQYHEKNLRISSELYNQPKSVDSIIDDFAVEAQNFTNSLTQVATLSALGLALQFITAIGSAVTSAIGIWIAIGSITNTSRYKNRNEEFRLKFFDEKFLHVVKAVYCQLCQADRGTIPLCDNPFYRLLEQLKDKFVADVKYYDYPKPVEFLRDYETLIDHIHEPDAIEAFSKEITTRFMADIYHVNSYLQADLVEIYTLTDELRRAEMRPGTSQSSTAVLGLFWRLILFVPRFETSLTRSVIKYGAFQSRAWKHSHIASLFQYAWAKLYCSRVTAGGCCQIPKTVEASKKASEGVWKPVAAETEEIIAQMRNVSSNIHGGSSAPAFAREILDMEQLYYATVESYVSSFIIVSGWLSFLTGIVFLVGNIGVRVNRQPWNEALVLGASFSFGIVTPISSILAFYYLSRQLYLIIKCDWALGRKLQEATTDKGRDNLRQILWVAKTQMVVTFMRLVASMGSGVALPWNLAAIRGAYPDRSLPLTIAVASVALQIISIIYLFGVEYSTLYNLDPKLGEFVSVAFDDELQLLAKDLTVPKSATETVQVQERAKWEYVSRAFLHRYRFDTIFNANRFGNILQYIQSGLQYRRDPEKSFRFGGPAPAKIEEGEEDDSDSD